MTRKQKQLHNEMQRDMLYNNKRKNRKTKGQRADLIQQSSMAGYFKILQLIKRGVDLNGGPESGKSKRVLEKEAEKAKAEAEAKLKEEQGKEEIIINTGDTNEIKQDEESKNND